MNHLEKLAAALASGALLLTSAACGADNPSRSAGAVQTAANGDVFNDADVDFATGMIPHHAQALAMVDLTRRRDLSPEVTELTVDIQATQGPEIQKMAGWLDDWSKPVPETMRDHANAEGHGMGEMDSDLPGMMTEGEMADLEAAPDREFEDLWLEMMIEHHEGATEMARDEQQSGVFDPAVELAGSIENSQQAEIDRMKKLLTS